MRLEPCTYWLDLYAMFRDASPWTKLGIEWILQQRRNKRFLTSSTYRYDDNVAAVLFSHRIGRVRFYSAAPCLTAEPYILMCIYIYMDIFDCFSCCSWCCDGCESCDSDKEADECRSRRCRDGSGRRARRRDDKMRYNSVDGKWRDIFSPPVSRSSLRVEVTTLLPVTVRTSTLNGRKIVLYEHFTPIRLLLKAFIIHIADYSIAL